MDPLNLDALAASLALPCACQDDPPPCPRCAAERTVAEHAAALVFILRHTVWLANQIDEIRTKAETPLIFIDADSLSDMMRAMLALETSGGVSTSEGAAKGAEVNRMIRAGSPYGIAHLGYGHGPAKTVVSREAP